MICPRFIDFRTAFQVTAGTDVDGLPTWGPADDVLVAFRAFSGYAFTFPITVSTTSSDDAVAWVDEWDWYLSEPAMATNAPRFTLVRNDPSISVTRSGRVTLGLTAAGQAIVSTLSASSMDRLLRDVHLYAFDRTGLAVYWSPLHTCAFAPNAISV